MRRSLILFFFWALTYPSWGQDTRISLLTCGPGDAMYSMFGHSAVRVQDPSRGIDQVYNYGTFDFHTPNFYGKFMRGKLLYKLDLQSFRQFLREYQTDKREVYEEELLLEEGDKAAIMAFLADNYSPGKREYLYDFFFDNCSSRIRDVVEQALGPRLSYQFPETSGPATYRDAIDPYIDSRPWTDLGINLLLGMPTDRRADERGQMFLPDHLSANLAYARVDGEKPLLGPRMPIVTGASEGAGDTGLRPAWLFWGLAAGFVMLWFFFQERKVMQIADTSFWLLFGLAGCLVAFMWWGTDHQATQTNWNLLWLNPIQLAVGLELLARGKAGWLKIFGRIQLAAVLVLLAGWAWFPQELPMEAIPLVILLGFQSGRLAGWIRKRS